LGGVERGITARACVLILCAVIVLSACGGSKNSQSATTAPSTALVGYPIGTCPPAAMKGVYWSFRLHDRDGGTTQDDCGTIRGKVMATKMESDGDLHIKVQLDPQYYQYLAPGNQYQSVPSHCAQLPRHIRPCVQDLMVLEIIPQHCQGRRPYDQNCADHGYFLDPAAPQAGEYVEATGYSVRDFDKLHLLEGYPPEADGWAELHPVTALRVITPAPANSPNPTEAPEP
jgi:hypothetical protein